MDNVNKYLLNMLNYVHGSSCDIIMVAAVLNIRLSIVQNV